MSAQLRHQAGAPASKGGEFKARAYSDAQLELKEVADSQAMREDNALDRLGLTRADVRSVTVKGPLTQVFLNRPHKSGGYDEIRDDAEGAISYFRNGKLHREDGYALDWRATPSGIGDMEAYLDGVLLHDPAYEIGFDFQGIARTPEGIVQNWSSGSGHYTATVAEDSTTTFYRDGDIHRDGAPAIVKDDHNFTPKWFQNGKEIPCPIPDGPTVKVISEARNADLTRYTGSAYREDREVKDIAKDIRADLKRAQDAGVLPYNAEFKVTSRRDSMSKSIIIQVSGAGRWTPETTPEGYRFDGVVERIGNQYNSWEEGAGSSPQRRGFWLQTSLAGK